MKLKIALIGCRGIPNFYGGFEKLAECLSVGLVDKGHDVTVYKSHNHPYQKKNFYGVRIIHCYDPEFKLGTAGQFIYDWNCIQHARKEDYDVILFLGYTSSSIWGKFFPKRSVIISNMDGLEWKREKYNFLTRQFLKQAEKLAIKYSDFYVADSLVIQNYLQKKYHVRCMYIPYGSDTDNTGNNELLSSYDISKQEYYLLMARMEPENNVETILDGFYNSSSNKKFLVIGNTGNSFGQKLEKKFKADKRILFAGAIYDSAITYSLKYFSHLYFHGHSVGGTNPSLLEAMGSRTLIAAHQNEFNHAVLQKDAYYFQSSKDVEKLIESVNRDEKEEQMVENNFLKIETQYNWPVIIEQYNAYIIHCYLHKKTEKTFLLNNTLTNTLQAESA
jgi:glycosyltransferase involved in cell wall biosynthesis